MNRVQDRDDWLCTNCWRWCGEVLEMVVAASVEEDKSCTSRETLREGVWRSLSTGGGEASKPISSSTDALVLAPPSSLVASSPSLMLEYRVGILGMVLAVLVVAALAFPFVAPWLLGV